MLRGASTNTGFSLPDPFKWVSIPTGKVTLEEGYGTFDVPAFAITQYPITVAQYAAFIDDGGYKTEHYWTPEGWAWRQEKRVTQPHEWMDEDLEHFFRPDHPVMNVSWHEAMAFCGWLSVKLSEKVSLPTEQQWQRAAQGDSGWSYPWGPEFDPARCNNNLLETLGTSPVGAYPGGASPYGVMDMSGNVWEWTRSQYDDETYVIRGGAWWNAVEVLRVDSRAQTAPQKRGPDLGFRAAR